MHLQQQLWDTLSEKQWVDYLSEGADSRRIGQFGPSARSCGMSIRISRYDRLNGVMAQRRSYWIRDEWLPSIMTVQTSAGRVMGGTKVGSESLECWGDFPAINTATKKWSKAVNFVMALSNLRRLSGLILRCDQAVRNDFPKPKGKTSTSTNTRYLRSLSTPIFIPEKLYGKISLGSCIQPRRRRTLIICDFYSTSESSHAPLPRQWYQPRISSSSPVLIYFVNAISSSNHAHQFSRSRCRLFFSHGYLEWRESLRKLPPAKDTCRASWSGSLKKTLPTVK